MNEEEKVENTTEEPVVQEEQTSAPVVQEEQTPEPTVQEEPAPAPVVQEEPKTEEVPQEPSGDNKKGGNSFTIALLVIIVLLIGVIAILLLGGNNKNKNNESNNNENQEVNNENTNNENNNNENNNNENNNNENNNNENNNVNIEQIIEPTFAVMECGGINFSFQKATVLVNDMKASDKLGMLATVLSKMIDTNNLEAGVETEINIDIYEIAQKYFDITPEMEQQMGDGFGTGFLFFTRRSQKSFVKLIIGGCIGPGNEGHYVKHKESKAEGNTLISTYYYYYKKNNDVIDPTEDSVTQFPYSYYKSSTDTTPVYKEIVNDDSVDFEVFDTYDLYFDISSGNAKLIKIVYNAK